MPQCTANQGIHVLLPLLLTALHTLGDAPTCSLAALAQRLGVTVRKAAAVVTPLAEEGAPTGAAAESPVATAPTCRLSGILCQSTRKPVRPRTAYSMVCSYSSATT